MIVNDIEVYAIARAIKDLKWQDLPVNPLLHQMLSNIRPDNRASLLELLGGDIAGKVFTTDPNGAPPPCTPCPVAVVVREADPMPDLPEAVRLTAPQIQLAQKVGTLEKDYTAWAGSTANQTPLLFHQAAGLFLGAMAIGRRLHVQAPWGEKIFPNLYLMTAALSTYYRKTASLRLATEVARSAFPHLLLPEPGSPENFMALLAERLPDKLDELSKDSQERLLKTVPFAAQRSIIRDELSGFFKTMGRDYMAGMKERLMQMYDCPTQMEFSTNGKGLIVVRNSALSIFGASTPAELAFALTPADWLNGTLARFALLTPEPDYQERPRNKEYVPFDPLAERYHKLHEMLPMPVQDKTTKQYQTEEWSLAAPIWDYCDAYQESLRQLTAPGSTLDDRLRSTYGRLHVLALKIAIILAAMDWADAGDNTYRPKVEPAHWFRAMMIVETWRASAHRLMNELSDNTYSQTEAKILGLLGRQPEGMTKSELLRATHLSSRLLDEALVNLIDAGIMQQAVQQKDRGRVAKAYRLI